MTHGREERQGLPARPPGRRGRGRRLEDRERAALPRQLAPHSQARLTAPDDDDLVMCRHAAMIASPGLTRLTYWN